MKTTSTILALAALLAAAPARATEPLYTIELKGSDEVHAERADDADEADEAEVKYLDAWTLKGERNFLTGYPAVNADLTVNVAVEIPTGTSEKWETCTSSSVTDPVAFPRCNEAKPGRLMVQEVKKSARRIVSYLGYPGNYGSIPHTKGADGDPLDIIAIGPKHERGTVIPVKVVGVVRCDDGGDQDDKIIALTADSPLYSKVNSLADLENAAVNGAEIIRMWFDSYKGTNAASGMYCKLVENEKVAKQLITDAEKAFTAP
jgi:inorganic pyrophosphatase